MTGSTTRNRATIELRVLIETVTGRVSTLGTRQERNDSELETRLRPGCDAGAGHRGHGGRAPGAEVLALPHPLWVRIWGSLAAPIFVTLTGVLVAQTRQQKGYSLSHYLVRGGLIVLIGAFGQHPDIWNLSLCRR